jgi:hypothetical protein
MLAVILLELLRLAAKDRDVAVGYNVTFERNAIVSLADATGDSGEAARELEVILAEMLMLEPSARPAPSDLVNRMGSICRKFSESSYAAEKSIMKLIGTVAVPN